MSRSIEETFLACCRAFRSAGVPFVIVGAFAVSMWGNPRSTQDIDVIAAIELEKVPRLVTELDERSITLSADDLRAAIREGSHATAFDEDSLYHVDIRPATDRDTRRTLETARTVTWKGHEIPVASPEETIAHKLLFGSDQDVEDAEGIYVRRGEKLDRAELTARCEQLGVLDDLRAMERRVG